MGARDTTIKPGYVQTEIGIIPEHWHLQGLLKVLSIANGQVDPRNEPYKSMTLVAPDHIESGTGRLLEKRTAFEQKAVSGKYAFASGQIVYSKIRPYLRKATLVDFDGLCSADMYPLRPAEGVSAGFMLAVLLSHRFSNYAESVSMRSGMPKINRTEMADFVVALPPSAEQRAIAEVLSDVDALLAGLDRLIAKKRDFKQAAMQQLLTGSIRLPGFADTWATTSLSELAEIVSGGTPATGEPTYWNGDIKWCTPTDITALPGKYLRDTARSISALGLRSSGARLLPAGALLLCSRATIGELKIAAYEVCTNQGFKSLLCRPHVNNEFLYYKLLTMKAQMIERAFGSTFLEISTANVAALALAVPSLQEQSAIAEVLSGMDEELVALEARRAKTHALKQAMMQELLTGRIRLI